MPSEVETLELHRFDHVAEVVLARADSLNAISTALARELVYVTRRLAADADCRARVLSASGDPGFCVRPDLKERNARTDEEVLGQRVVFRAAFGVVLSL